MKKMEYSKNVFLAFVALLVTYGLIVWMLSYLQTAGLIKFKADTNGDLLPLMASLPFVALYLVVLIAATAGYARGAIMAKQLPFNQLLKRELDERKMQEAGIVTKIRSGDQVKADTSYFNALKNITSSRVPILAVVDDHNKVTGVITDHDVIRKLQEEIDKNDHKTLYDRLENLKVQDLKPRPAVVATIKESLQDVIGNMIRNQFTKLIVVEDKSSHSFSGTVDVLDLVGEIVEVTPEK